MEGHQDSRRHALSWTDQHYVNLMAIQNRHRNIFHKTMKGKPVSDIGLSLWLFARKLWHERHYIVYLQANSGMLPDGRISKGAGQIPINRSSNLKDLGRTQIKGWFQIKGTPMMYCSTFVSLKSLHALQITAIPAPKLHAPQLDMNKLLEYYSVYYLQSYSLGQLHIYKSQLESHKHCSLLYWLRERGLP